MVKIQCAGVGKHQIQVCTTQKEIISQTDKYLVSLSSKRYVFISLTNYFFQCTGIVHPWKMVQTSMRGDCNLFYAKA